VPRWICGCLGYSGSVPPLGRDQHTDEVWQPRALHGRSRPRSVHESSRYFLTRSGWPMTPAASRGTPRARPTRAAPPCSSRSSRRKSRLTSAASAANLCRHDRIRSPGATQSASDGRLPWVPATRNTRSRTNAGSPCASSRRRSPPPGWPGHRSRDPCSRRGARRSTRGRRTLRCRGDHDEQPCRQSRFNSRHSGECPHAYTL